MEQKTKPVSFPGRETEVRRQVEKSNRINEVDFDFIFVSGGHFFVLICILAWGNSEMPKAGCIILLNFQG